MVGADFISRYRMQTTAWLEALEELVNLKGQWVALDLGNTLTEGDFAGANQDITLAELTAAVSSMDAMYGAFVDGFHNSTLYKLKQ
jgi:hypothetical protein